MNDPISPESFLGTAAKGNTVRPGGLFAKGAAIIFDLSSFDR